LTSTSNCYIYRGLGGSATPGARTFSHEPCSVTKLEKALYAKWISRFGRTKIKDLAEGLDVGRSVSDRSKAVVASSSDEEIQALLLEGFDGYFHQTVYLRSVKKTSQTADAVNAIPEGKSVNSVELEKHTSDVADDEARCLLMVTQTMEFLPKEGAPVIHDIPFPVAVGVAAGALTVQVLTMQITLNTWGELLGKDLRRMLTPVHADTLSDEALNFLRTSKVDIGEYVDYSDGAVKLMKRADINTYSGTFEVGTVGSTKHDTVRGKGKRPLRTSMKTKFEELVSADRIVNAEIELSRDYLGLKSDSKIALYPTVGKMAFRSRLQGRDPDEFITEIATG